MTDNILESIGLDPSDGFSGDTQAVRVIDRSMVWLPDRQGSDWRAQSQPFIRS